MNTVFIQKKAIFAILIVGLVLFNISAQLPGGVHPAYEMDDLAELLSKKGFKTKPNNAFQPSVTGLAFMEDGTLVMTTMRTFSGHPTEIPGDVYLIKGLTGKGQLDVKIIAEAMTPLGILVLKDSIYVQEFNSLNLLVDENKDGKWEKKKIYSGFLKGKQRQWTFGVVQKDNHLFITPGVTMFSGKNIFPQTFDEAGNMLKLTKGGKFVEIFSRGFRNPDGIFLGPEGEIFSMDDQGTWRPSSTLIHVKKGGYYAHLNHNSEKGMKISNGITWLPHRRVSQSPHGPLYVTKGQYRGQILYADCAVHNGVFRVFMERVGGIYQGNVHDFSGGMKAGTHDVAMDHEGNFYIGGIGNGEMSNWGWRGKKWSFQRLRPKGNTAFEMLAVRSLGPTSYEIEFTQPVKGPLSPKNFKAEQFTYAPAAGYGAGNAVQRQGLAVESVSLSDDSKRATLTFKSGALKEKFQTYIQAVNVTSSKNEKLWSNRTYYQLNRFGPADRPGCLDRKYEEYDSKADYDPGSGVACRKLVDTKATAFDLGNGPFNLEVKHYPGLIRLSVSARGAYRVTLSDVQGVSHATRSGLHPRVFHISTENMPQGVYYISLRMSKNRLTKKICLM